MNDSAVDPLEEKRIDAELKKVESWHGVLKIVYGTMIVGVAAAVFPFASQFAQSFFAASIERQKGEVQLEIEAEKTKLEKEKLELERLLEVAKSDRDSTTAYRDYLEKLAAEARSERIETRIVLAEFFTYMAETPDRRSQWKEFRDHLYETQQTLNSERATLISKANDPDTSNQERVVAERRLDQIEYQINPKFDPKRQIQSIIIDGEPNLSVDEIRSYHLSLGWSDVGFHFFVDMNGEVYNGRPMDFDPAFAQGQNKGAIAVGVACDTWVDVNIRPILECDLTKNQIEATEKLIISLRHGFNIDGDRVLLRSDLRPMSQLINRSDFLSMNRSTVQRVLSR
ncbi:MAG: hypothetical protein OEY05_04540 [Paracoccaceae bacterium]|nr:hypothetical protein [Paracoccaceae bacterium]